MDARPEDAGGDPVVVTGLGHVVVGPGDPPCDPMPYLKVKKLRKYMGVQDDLAVVAAAKALESAGLLARSASEGLGERTGLFLAVGYIPFEGADLDPLLAASLDAGSHFSMEAFSTAGFRTVNGLLTFRCLPNMPAFHVSANFDIQGPYFVTYPGPGQFYVALEEALIALEEGSINVALVGGVAHQRNFLVESHFARVNPPVPAGRLGDAAGCLTLERNGHAAARGAVVRGTITQFQIKSIPHNPFKHELIPSEKFAWRRGEPLPGNGEGLPLSTQRGAASLPVFLSQSAAPLTRVAHDLRSRDGVIARSCWSFS
jgi:3-oxoacyl-(acyl-carrier-protein) synthase